MKRQFLFTMRVALVLAVAIGSGALPVRAARPAVFPTYTLTDLGTLGGSISAALDINAAGQIVGAAYTTSNNLHPFLYSDGVMSDLGTLGGRDGGAGSINSMGQIVGQADTADDRRHAFLYSNGVMSDLGTLGGPDSRAFDMNDSGQIVGISTPLGSGFQHAFLYDAGIMTDLGTLPGGHTSYANSINASGQIAGWSSPTSDTTQAHAYLYNGGVMTDLGTLGGSRSVAFALNDTGQIVGWSDIPGDTSSHAFLFRNGGMTDLGTLGGSSQAVGINNRGEVVGSAYTLSGQQHAFLYRQGLMQDLNDLIPPGSGWVLTYASEINTVGQIVGSGLINGQQHAFLLTPRSPSPLIDDLIALVRSFHLPQGIENSLIVKLQNAKNALAVGNTDGACNALAAFLHEVSAQTGKALTAAQADQLIAGAGQIQAVLGCQ